MSRRRGPVIIESLELRRLLAATYRLADYFPIANGLEWHYTGTREATIATLDLSSTLTKSSITFTAKLDGGTITSSSTYSVDANGLKTARTESVNEDQTKVVIQYPTAPALLGSTVTVGEMKQLLNIPVTETVTTAAGVTTTLTGTEGQTTTVQSLELLKLHDFRFVHTLKVISDRTRKVAGVINGVGYDFVTHIISTTWYGEGLGIVQTETLEADTSMHAGTTDHSSEEQSFGLDKSPLLPTLTTKLDSHQNLIAVGTGGNDQIRVVDYGDNAGDEFGDADNTVMLYARGVGTAYQRYQVKTIQIFAGGGNDLVISQHDRGIYVDAGEGNDTVTGSAGDDTITGGAGKDLLDGGAGNDRLNGNGGHDHLIGGEGADRLYGGDGNDTLEGNAGPDRIWAGAGDDLLTGGSSNDKLFGEDGSDQLFGGTENDLLDGGAGSDSLNGGGGNDMLVALDSTLDHLDGGDAIVGNDSVTSDGADLLINI